MPEKFENFLTTLSDEDAKELYDYLEGNSDAVQTMLECISLSHEEL